MVVKPQCHRKVAKGAKAKIDIIDVFDVFIVTATLSGSGSVRETQCRSPVNRAVDPRTSLTGKVQKYGAVGIHAQTGATQRHAAEAGVALHICDAWRVIGEWNPQQIDLLRLRQIFGQKAAGKDGYKSKDWKRPVCPTQSGRDCVTNE
jgi:hypothetical protein